MPVKVVVGSNAVPTTVLWFQRVVRPAHSGVEIAYDYALAGKAQRPDRRSVDVEHTPLDGVRGVRATRRDFEITDLGILDPARGLVGINVGHVRALGKMLDQRTIGFGDQHVGRPKGLIHNALSLE